jgi:hypothetical protein
MELKSGSNKSQHPDLPTAPSFVVIGAVLRKICQIGDCCMWPAGNLTKESSGKFWNRFKTTYSAAAGGCVALEYAVVDLDIGTIGIHSSTLEVVCPPPGIGAESIFRTCLFFRREAGLRCGQCPRRNCRCRSPRSHHFRHR